MKHSLSELQDLLDSGQLDPAAHEDPALQTALEALPALLEVARLALPEETNDVPPAGSIARLHFEP